MASRFISPREQVFDANGHPLSGAKLYFYTTGTTTPEDTFSDPALSTPNANPVVADSAGRFGSIYLDPAVTYKAVLKDSADVTIWTADPCEAYLWTGDAAGVRSAIGAAGLGANTFTADQTVQSTDAGAGEGPSLVLDRNSASPAASDLLGALRFDARSSTAVTRAAAKIVGELLDATNASEDARLLLQTIVAGTLATRLAIGQGLVVGAATGGDQGAGTINATEFYRNGSALLFGSSYDSGDITVTSAAGATLTHGLGGQPRLIQIWLKCATTEGGYAVGEEVLIQAGENADNTQARGLSVIANSTQIKYRIGSDANAFLILAADTGNRLSITNANWRLIIRAYR